MSLTDSMQIIDDKPDHSFWNNDSSSDKAPKRCAEPGCTNSTGTTPTGRRAKYCDVHKSASDRSGNAPKGTRTRRSGWAEKEAVRASLTQFVTFAGAGLSVINKADGQIIANGGPNIVNALVDLAEDDKNIRKYLNFAAKPGKYGPLTLAVLGVVIPVMANHNLLPTFLVDLSGDDSRSANHRGGESE